MNHDDPMTTERSTPPPARHFTRAILRCAAAFALLAFACRVQAAPTPVTTAAELVQAVLRAQPGDVVELANGTYSNFEVVLRGHGREGAPVVIQAQTPGRVVLNGASSVEIDGTWLELRGLVFRDGNPPLAKTGTDTNTSAIKIKGSHNRLTETTIINYSLHYKDADHAKVEKSGSHRWVGLWGQHHRVDHNHFQGKHGAGVLLTVWRDSSEPNHHQIDHNAFIDVAYGHEQNGWETIRIGTSTHSQSKSLTVVEYNYFDRCDGEIEIISNKSGGNVFRFNTFNNSRGTLTLRHGTDALVENNAFFIDSDSLGGGIRISDKNHIVRNNYIEGVRGPTLHWAGIALLAHSKNAPINDYWPVENLLVENNVIVNSASSIVIGAGRALQSPVSASFRNNLVCNASNIPPEAALYQRVADKEGRFSLQASGNKFCALPGKESVAGELEESFLPTADMVRAGPFLAARTLIHGFKSFRPTGSRDVGPSSYSPRP